MKRSVQGQVKLPVTLRRGLEQLIELLQSGASTAEREIVLADLRNAFVRSVQRGLITSAQERAFALRLHEICGNSTPIQLGHTDEIILN